MRIAHATLILLVLRVLVNGGTTTSDNVTSYTTDTVQTTDAVFDFTGTTTYNSTVITNYTSNFMKSLEDYPFWNTIWILLKYGAFASSLPGIVTNSLSVYVSLFIKPFGSSEMYMCVLGVTDILLCICRLIKAVYDLSLIPVINAYCKTLGFLISAFATYSNFIVVMWSCERFIAVYFPMNLIQWCTMFRVKSGLIILCFISFVLNIPYMFAYETDKFGVNCAYTDFHTNIWFLIESIYWIYFPVVFLILINFSLVYKTLQMSRKRIQLAKDSDTAKRRAKEQAGLTRMLIVISAMFVILHIPALLVMIFFTLTPNLSDILEKRGMEAYVKFVFWVAMGVHITEYQNSLNFFLYAFSGSKFRKTLLKICCRCRNKHEDIPSSTMVSTVSSNPAKY